MMLFVSALAGLVQTAPADTVFVIPQRDFLTYTAEVAVVVIAVLFTVFMFTTLGVFLQSVRMVKTANRIGHDLRAQVAPTVARVQTVADNMAYVSAAVRQDMERIHESVAKLTGHLNQASDRVEERIEEFNALLEVVQVEAEDLFLDTASTVRAVKAGARSLSRPLDEPPPPPTSDE